jgi:hypothetical protein
MKIIKLIFIFLIVWDCEVFAVDINNVFDEIKNTNENVKDSYFTLSPALNCTWSNTNLDDNRKVGFSYSFIVNSFQTEGIMNMNKLFGNPNGDYIDRTVIEPVPVVSVRFFSSEYPVDMGFSICFLKNGYQLLKKEMFDDLLNIACSIKYDMVRNNIINFGIITGFSYTYASAIYDYNLLNAPEIAILSYKYNFQNYSAQVKGQISKKIQIFNLFCGLSGSYNMYKIENNYKAITYGLSESDISKISKNKNIYISKLKMQYNDSNQIIDTNANAGFAVLINNFEIEYELIYNINAENALSSISIRLLL